MKELILILWLIPSTSYAYCFCACSNGKSVPACTEALELPNIVCNNIC